VTLTPYANVVPCGSAPAAFQSAYDFTTGIQCWTAKVDSGTNYITGFGTTNLVQHNGHSVLAVSVSNPTGSTVNVSIDFIVAIATSQVLTSGSISGYAMIDSNLLSGSPQGQAYNISAAAPAPAYNFDDANNNWPSVTATGWAAVTQSSVVNTNTQQVGIQVFNVAIPAGASGNIYLADVSIVSSTIPTSTATGTFTSTLTPTVANTSTPTGTPTVTATITNTPGLTLTPFPGSACNPTTIATLYNFTNGLQCWGLDGGSTYATGIGTTAAVTYINGHSVLCVTFNNTSAAVASAQIEINFGSAQNLVGGSVTLYAMADQSLVVPSETTGWMGGQVFDSNSTYNFEHGTGVGLSGTAGTWTTLIDNGSTNAGITTTGVIQLGVQFFNIAPGASGNIYIADVNVASPSIPTPTLTGTPVATSTSTLTATPTVTATITNTPGITLTPFPGSACNPTTIAALYNFTNGLQCWGLDGNSTNATGIGTTAAVTYINGHSVFCVTFNNTTAAVASAQIEINFGSAQNLVGGSVTLYAMADQSLVVPSETTGWMGGQVFDSDSTYNFEHGTGVGLSGTAGTWTTLIDNGSTNTGITTANVIQMGVQFYNIAPGASGNIYIADVNIGLPAVPTATSTPTGTPTQTFTDVPGTATYTPSPTSSPAMSSTPTETPTSTNIPGVTMTPIANVSSCNGTLLSLYDFTNGLQCWNVTGTGATGIGTTAAVTYINGHSVLCVTVNNTAAVTTTLNIQLAYAAAQNLTGAAVTAWVMADQTLVVPSESYGNMGAVLYDQNSAYNWEAVNYTNLSTTAGTWTAIRNSNITNANTLHFGVQVYNIAPGATGNIYIADVSVVLPAGTPTYTPTVSSSCAQTWTFDDGYTDYWYASTGGVTGVANITSPTYGASAGALDVLLSATVGVNYARVQIDSGESGDYFANGTVVSTAGGPATVIDFINCSISGFQCYVYLNNGLSSYSTGVFPYIVTTGKTYGGTYNGWPQQCSGSCPYPAANTWTLVKFGPAMSTTSGGDDWSVDGHQVEGIGMDFNTGSAVTGDIIVDQVSLY
jgi:hypothetical protein